MSEGVMFWISDVLKFRISRVRNMGTSDLRALWDGARSSMRRAKVTSCAGLCRNRVWRAVLVGVKQSARTGSRHPNFPEGHEGTLERPPGARIGPSRADRHHVGA